MAKADVVSGFQPLRFISVFTLFLEAWCPALLLPAFHDGTSRSCECVARLSSVISDTILISSATWSLVTFRGTVVSQNPQLGATICYQFVFQVACGFFIATPTWERVWGIWNNEWMAIFLWSLSIRIFGLTITAIIIWIKSSIFWTIVVTTYQSRLTILAGPCIVTVTFVHSALVESSTTAIALDCTTYTTTSTLRTWKGLL